MPPVDLSKPEDLLAYMTGTPYAASSVELLSGGGTNFVFRLSVACPIPKGDTPTRLIRTVIVKHAKRHFEYGGERVEINLRRQEIEVNALRLVKTLLPPDSLVCVPEVYAFDSEANIIIMEDCKQDGTLKGLLKANLLPPETAPVIGRGLGEFMARLHGQCTREVLEDFRHHPDGRRITSWAVYGQIIPTLTGEADLPGLSDPPLVIAEEDVSFIEKVAGERRKAILDANEILTMGDLHPGNILVRLNSKPDANTCSEGALKIFIIDWELAKPGLTYIDLGAFASEVNMLRQFIPHCTQTARSLLTAFFGSYFTHTLSDIGISGDARARVVEKQLSEIKSHMAGHTIVFAPRVRWGVKQKARELVTGATKMMVHPDGPAGDSMSDFFKDVYEFD